MREKVFKFKRGQHTVNLEANEWMNDIKQTNICSNLSSYSLGKHKSQKVWCFDVLDVRD